MPRTVIFAGKAAPGYAMAKLIIQLINDVADVVNSDARIGDRLKVVFLPNYRVSLAELIIPGADLSEQISTAGKEASGTGNMKLALNGALTIGTLDGANIEIRDSVGADNFFLFGLTARRRCTSCSRTGYQPRGSTRPTRRFKRALDAIASGVFSPDEPDRYRGLVDALLWGGDHYMLLADFDAYVAAQAQVDALYRDGERLDAQRASPTSRRWARSRRIAASASTRRASGVSCRRRRQGDRAAARARPCLAARRELRRARHQLRRVLRARRGDRAVRLRRRGRARAVAPGAAGAQRRHPARPPRRRRGRDSSTRCARTAPFVPRPGIASMRTGCCSIRTRARSRATSPRA